MFGALVDAERGGAFVIGPSDPFEVERRYVGRSNVFESTFSTATGVVRLTDGLMLQDGGELGWVELVRRVEGVDGAVRMGFSLSPRFGFGAAPTIESRRDALLVCAEGHTLAFRCWGAGEPRVLHGTIDGDFTLEAGEQALLSCVLVTDGPIPYPTRAELEDRLRRTVETWERWVDLGRYEGSYAAALERSALVLRLLTSSRTGSVAAAPTTSLPERIGGDQNWDYRFAWVRDTAFTLDALIGLGYRGQVHESLSWLLRATEATHPELSPFYALDGSLPGPCTELDLDGYRGSRPVRNGNGAATQLQLGAYGDLLQTIWLYVRHGNGLDGRTAARVAELADHICELWPRTDSGIWELDDEQQYTHSLIQAWAGLDRALRLVEEGEVPGDHAEQWRRERQRVRSWVDEHCWSDARQSYTFYAGTDRLDASLLLAGPAGFLPAGHPRLEPTIDAIRGALGAGGPLLYRYSGQEDREGAFLACSFWLVAALAHVGRLDDAHETMEQLLALANDVGLFAEEIDPSTHAFLGNFPQGLTHLSLITAAQAIESAENTARGDV